MSITVKKNLELLHGVIPEGNDSEFGLPHVVYEQFAKNGELRLMHVERLNKFRGLLAGVEGSSYQVQAFNQMRYTLGMTDARDMRHSFAVMLDVLDQLKDVPDSERESFLKDKQKELENGYYMDRDKVRHTVDLGAKSNGKYFVAGLAAVAIAAYSGIGGFALAFYNTLLSLVAAKGHGETLFDKLQQRPRILKDFPDMFNMLLMESYVEHRMKMAFQPLEYERGVVMREVMEDLDSGEWRAEHTDKLAVVEAEEVLAKLMNYAPSRAIRLLQMPATAPNPAWEEPKSPRHAFKPFSNVVDAIHDKLSVEYAMRSRFDYQTVSDAVRSRIDSQLQRAGHDPEHAIKPGTDLKPPERFDSIPDVIRATADRMADAALDGKKLHDLPIVSRILMPDYEKVPENERHQVVKERLSGTLQRLAISLQQDRWEPKEQGTQLSGLLKRRMRERHQAAVGL